MTHFEPAQQDALPVPGPTGEHDIPAENVQRLPGGFGNGMALSAAPYPGGVEVVWVVNAGRVAKVRVDGGRSKEECRWVAYAIAHSPLVKTAFFASDPNLGRILAAVGYAGIADLDQSLIDLHLDDVHVATKGGRHPAYQEADGQRVMKQSEITVRVDLHRGAAHATVWTCDLSHDYVTINADYRS